MKSRFLTAIWITIAVVVLPISVAAGALHGSAQKWAVAILGAGFLLGCAATFGFNRTQRGLWFPGNDGRGGGVTPRNKWVWAVLIALATYLTVRPAIMP